MIVHADLSLAGHRVAVQDVISGDQIEGVQWVDTQTRALGLGVAVPRTVPPWTIRPTQRRFWRLVDLWSGLPFAHRSRPVEVLAFNFYPAALERWSQILSDYSTPDVEGLAASLGSEQDWFEANCGGPDLGREVMVISGIGRYYNTDASFRARLAGARFVADAFAASGCSPEVKAHARHAGRFYGLDCDTVGHWPEPVAAAESR